MVPETQLKDLLAVASLSQTDRALLLLGARDPSPLKVADLRTLGAKHGLRSAKTFNASQFLSKARTKAVSTVDGWELTQGGRDHVATLLRQHAPATTPIIVSTLRHHAAAIPSIEIRAFVHEAVICFETSQLRAAVVLSWVGAVAVLYDHVISHHLTKFNAEAVKKFPKWKDATTADDLTRMKEADFLEVLASSSIIGKNVKHELGACLTFRNGCGHPNSLKVGEQRVAAHIETLILNVFKNY